VPGLVVTLHLIDMVRDAVDFCRRFLHGLRRAIRSFGRFVRRDLCLRCGLLGVFCRLLRLGSGSLCLLGLLIVVRGASRKGDR
jgi:hypothetical protein